MKNYRYANLLIIILLLLSTLSFIGVKTGLYSAISNNNVNIDETPLVTSNTSENLDKIDVVAKAEIDEIIAAPVISAKTTKSTPSKCSVDYAKILINGKTICVFTTNDLGVDAGQKVAMYNGNFLFGHNSAAVFADLGRADTFQIVKGAETKTYKIMSSQVYCDYSNAYQYPDNPEYKCANYNQPVLSMSAVLNPAKKGADFSLMTCAGQGVGNGDATHRLVAYAVQI
jgi:hypothetical protein